MSSDFTEISVNIRSLAVGGAGVGEVTAQNDGRTDLLGITAFVPFSAVGENVLARVISRKERYLQAELVQVQQPAAWRVSPPCKLFTNCGGCELQHIGYSAQLEAKHDMILGALRSGRLPTSDLEKLEAIVPSDEYSYRRRISLHIDQTGKVGFYRESSRSVVATDHCPVAVPAINSLLRNIAEFGREVKGKVSSLLLESDDEGVVAVLKSPYDISTTEAGNLLSLAKKYFVSALILASDKEVAGFGRQILELPLNAARTLTLRVPAGYFSQVNTKINLKLVSSVLEILRLPAAARVFDLYAGAGNFALPIAKAGMRVSAVECDKRLVALGRENASRYGLQRSLEYSEMSVEKFLAPYGSKYRGTAVAELPAAIIADPPRSGLGNMCSQLPESEKLVLVSCHLPSFVRDCKNLIERGWELKRIIPFDMFAQTSYLEILSHFERR